MWSCDPHQQHIANIIELSLSIILSLQHSIGSGSDGDLTDSFLRRDRAPLLHPEAKPRPKREDNLRDYYNPTELC